MAAIKTSGNEYDEMKAKINKKNPALPARSLVIVKITEIFECKPGPTARLKTSLKTSFFNNIFLIMIGYDGFVGLIDPKKSPPNPCARKRTGKGRKPKEKSQ